MKKYLLVFLVIAFVTTGCSTNQEEVLNKKITELNENIKTKDIEIEILKDELKKNNEDIEKLRKEVVDKDNEMNRLKSLSIENQINDTKQVLAPNLETDYLKNFGTINLHYYYGGGYPAFGYKAEVNTFPLGEDMEDKVELIERHDQWAKINVSGWIPTWYLTKERPNALGEAIDTDNRGQKRTIRVDTHLYLAPEKDYIDNDSAAELNTRQVVEILYGYGDWFYVKRFVNWDANELPEGWIKKSDLATFDEIKPIEVMVKKETIFYEYGSNIEEGKLDKDTFGRMNDVENGWYDISCPGATGFRVKEKDITYGD